MSVNRFNYLDIGDEPVMKDGLNLARYDIWSSLFPINTRRWGRNGTDVESDGDDETDENALSTEESLH